MRRRLGTIAPLLGLLVLLVAMDAWSQSRATSFLRGRVFLEGSTNHSGTVVRVLGVSTLGTSSGAFLGSSVLGVLVLLAAFLRRRRLAGFIRAALVLAAVGLGSIALGAFRVESAASGFYEISPPGGGTFASDQYWVAFNHAGYTPHSEFVTLNAGSAGVVTLADVTLQKLPDPECTIFPADNPWNTDISHYDLHPRSQAYIDFIGSGDHLHPDFGTFWEGAPIGIPYVVVPANQPKLTVQFDYDDESDPGPYPIPPNPPIEGGSNADGDRHILMLDLQSCMLYELFWAWPPGVGENPYDNVWYAGSGAIFDLRSNALRPDGWTSADAAGLPILPGLVRYDEVVQAGVINHALRFTVRDTQRGYIHPATHFASDTTNQNVPPMGLRLRMKSDYNCSSYSHETQVVCAALKKCGMFVADNGSDWYITGQHDPRWDDEALNDIKRIPGSAFEAVYTGPILTSSD